MSRRAIKALFGAALVVALSACGASSDSPESIDDIRETIEEAGYECDDPTTDEEDRTELGCGEDIYAIWYPSAADEVTAFDALDSVYEDLPVDLYVIRGDQWRVSGDEGAVTKVAEALNKDVTSVGN